jgi:hypothetical protein
MQSDTVLPEATKRELLTLSVPATHSTQAFVSTLPKEKLMPPPKLTVTRMEPFSKGVGLMLTRTPFSKVAWVTSMSAMVSCLLILPAGPKSV